MCPLEIEIMLHHYYTPSVWPRRSEAADEYMRVLLHMEMLREWGPNDRPANIDSSPYKIAERGMAYVQMLMRMPLPQPAWVDGEGRVVQIDYREPQHDSTLK